MLIALTHAPSTAIERCQLSFIERQRIDFERCMQQHAAYCQALEACGAKVEVLHVNESEPDGAFIEDTAVVLDEIAVMTSMGAESRRAEVARVDPAIAKYRKIERIEWPGTLEGGDVLQMGKKIFVGLTKRTNQKGIDSLARITRPFGYEVFAIGVSGALHLKSAVGAIDDGTVIVNPAWMDLEPFKNYEIVHVPHEEPWGANVVRICESVVAPTAHPRTANLIAERGIEVKRVDLSEFFKAEAGATCLSLRFQFPGGGGH